MERKIDIAQLKLGMYVSALDRPWQETPFLIEGFLVRHNEELFKLNELCRYVYIDPSRGLPANTYENETQRLKTNNYLERYLQDNKRKVEYENTVTTREELPMARSAIESAALHVEHIMSAVRAGKGVDIASVHQVVEPIMESIIRNSEAYIWLSMIQKKSSYTYSHSVDNCALAIAFGRYMGLPKKDLKTLAIGLLMMDIGNVMVPQAVLEKKGKLSEAEYRVVQKHVQHGVDILQTTKGMSEDIVNIALTHHERFDGSGYPNGMAGVQIPVYGRMAAIIDCYDALTSDRPFSKARSPYYALQTIYDLRDTAFQPELVEQFLQCIGIYPTGSLVELTSGEVGVVLSQDQTQRMRPEVMLIMDKDKQMLDDFITVNLATQYKDDAGYPLNIRRGLDPGEYGIDPADLFL